MLKIPFLRVFKNELPIETQVDEISIKGVLKRENASLVTLNAELDGEISHTCDRCGDEINLKIDESLEILLSDGISKLESLDVVEFFDGYIDIDELVRSEVEAYKSGFFYCEKCKNL